MRHSQRSSETPLKCWIICETSGEVCCAHCNCMAGLGEACTHVAALLFYLETAARIDGVSSCTREQCTWVIPGYQKDIPYLPISKIDFSSPSSKRRSIEEALQNVTQSSTPTVTTSAPKFQFTPPTDAELTSLFQALSLSGTKPAILSLISEHASAYVPKSQQDIFPQPLSTLVDYPACIGLSYDKHVTVCSNKSIVITQTMAESIERSTKDQSKAKPWYSYRAGHVTASKMKQVCRTRIEKPSRSLLQFICYPQSHCFNTAATRWGCDHKKLARDHYYCVMAQQYEKLIIEDSGFVINPSWPHVGASPDGVIHCMCCGKGTLEIKCSFCHRDENMEAVAQDKRSCLTTFGGNISLNRDHAYYYQVLTQILVCDVEYGDFCICTFPNGLQSPPSFHIERILPDSKVWEECICSATMFFRKCILPELTVRFYTQSQPSVMSVTSEQALHDHTYYCKMSSTSS